jgi:hypothetical protein
VELAYVVSGALGSGLALFVVPAHVLEKLRARCRRLEVPADGRSRFAG